jgi:hypothetical protein
MTSPPTEGTYPYPNEPTRSRSEKAIARKAFDAALKRELQEVMRRAKQMANEIKEPADVWALENYLTRRRKEIDSKYDFHPSRLMGVFGKLLYERRVTEDELLVFQRAKTKGNPFLRQGSR